MNDNEVVISGTLNAGAGRYGATNLKITELGNWLQMWVDWGHRPTPANPLIVEFHYGGEMPKPPSVEQQRHDELVTELRRLVEVFRGR